jgi:hypothetical protein
LTDHELHERYRQAHNLVERSHWQFVWLIARGLTATAIARVTGYSAYWIGQIARLYNAGGPEALRDGRRRLREQRFPLDNAHQAALRQALVEPLPAGDHWCGRTVATPMSACLGRLVSCQASFKVRLRPLLREVATAFPHARVDLWAVDEHRIGLKPILHKAWCVEGQRPIGANLSTDGH